MIRVLCIITHTARALVIISVMVAGSGAATAQAQGIPGATGAAQVAHTPIYEGPGGGC